MSNWEWNSARCAKSIVTDNRRRFYSLTKTKPGSGNRSEQSCLLSMTWTMWSQKFTSQKREEWMITGKNCDQETENTFCKVYLIRRYAQTIGCSTRQENSNDSVPKGNLSTWCLPQSSRKAESVKTVKKKTAEAKPDRKDHCNTPFSGSR